MARYWLDQNQVIGMPTETVYGLAGNAFQPEAALRIFKVKHRPAFDPLIVHTSHTDRLSEIISDFPAPLQALAATFWPGPLTLLLPRGPKIPDIVTSGLPTVAVRIPKHPLAHELLSKLEYPLAAPSANPFGYISPTTALHVQDQLGDQIPYILDGGPAQVGLESTIIGMEDEQLVVYRMGGLNLDALEQAAGQPLSVRPHSSSNPSAPGMLKSHYAPKVPLFIQDVGQLLTQWGSEDLGALAFQEYDDRLPQKHQVVLSPSGDLDEAARNLFKAMRALDGMNIKAIGAQLCPEIGLGKAINDRLRRAAAPE